MQAGNKKPVSVDEYIATFPAPVQKALKKIRAVIRKAAPMATEQISYGMPAYRLDGPLVYFAGYATHIGFYALPSGHAGFRKEMAGYKQGKGSVQFPLSQPLPVELISRIVKFRVAENLGKAIARRPAKKKQQGKSETDKKSVQRPAKRGR